MEVVVMCVGWPEVNDLLGSHLSPPRSLGVAGDSRRRE